MTAVSGAPAGPAINPVAKFAAALVLTLALVLTVDWVSASTALVCEAVLLPLSGIGWRRFWVRTAPAWLAAPFAALALALYGPDSGAVYVVVAGVIVTQGSVTQAVAIGLRVLAIALPGIVLFATTDLTDLADGLAQTWRLPARFVLAALAAMRLMASLADDWRTLTQARRARGLGGRGRVFGMLVLALRRGAHLSDAMEARGFGSGPRTWARRARFGGREVGLIGIGAGVAALALTLSVVTGSWHFVGA